MSTILGAKQYTTNESMKEVDITRQIMKSIVKENKQHCRKEHGKKTRTSNKDLDFDRKVRVAVVSTCLADPDGETMTTGCSPTDYNKNDAQETGEHPTIREMFNSLVDQLRPITADSASESGYESAIVPPYQMVMPRCYKGVINRGGTSTVADSNAPTTKINNLKKKTDDDGTATTTKGEDSSIDSNSLATGSQSDGHDSSPSSFMHRVASVGSSACKSIGTRSTCSSMASSLRRHGEDGSGTSKDGTSGTGSSALQWDKMDTLGQEELLKYIHGMSPSSAKTVALQTLRALETSCNSSQKTNRNCLPIDATATNQITCSDIVGLSKTSKKTQGDSVAATADEKSFYFDSDDDDVILNNYYGGAGGSSFDTGGSSYVTMETHESMETELTFIDDETEWQAITAINEMMDSFNAGIQRNSIKQSELRKRHEDRDEEQRPSNLKKKQIGDGDSKSGSNDSTNCTKKMSNTTSNNRNMRAMKRSMDRDGRDSNVRSLSSRSSWKKKINLLKCAFGGASIQKQKQLAEDNSTNVVVAADSEGGITIKTMARQHRTRPEDISHTLQLLMCLCKERQLSESDFYHATTTKLTVEKDDHGCIEGFDATAMNVGEEKGNKKEATRKPCWPASGSVRTGLPNDFDRRQDAVVVAEKMQELSRQPRQSQQQESLTKTHCVRVITTTNSQAVYKPSDVDGANRGATLEVVKDVEIIKSPLADVNRKDASSPINGSKDVVLSYPSRRQRSLAKLKLLNCTGSKKMTVAMLEANANTTIDEDAMEDNVKENKQREQESAVVIGDLNKDMSQSSTLQRLSMKPMTPLNNSVPFDEKGSLAALDELVKAVRDEVAEKSLPIKDSTRTDKSNKVILPGKIATPSFSVENAITCMPPEKKNPNNESIKSEKNPVPDSDIDSVIDAARGSRVKNAWNKTKRSGSPFDSLGSLSSREVGKTVESLAAQFYRSDQAGQRQNTLEGLPSSRLNSLTTTIKKQDLIAERSKSSSSTKGYTLSQATVPNYESAPAPRKTYTLDLFDIRTSHQSTPSTSFPQQNLLDSSDKKETLSSSKHAIKDRKLSDLAGNRQFKSTSSSPQMAIKSGAESPTPPSRHTAPTDSVEVGREMLTPSPLSYSSSPVANGLKMPNDDEGINPANKPRQSRRRREEAQAMGARALQSTVQMKGTDVLKEMKQNEVVEESKSLSFLLRDSDTVDMEFDPPVSVPPRIRRMTEDESSEDQERMLGLRSCAPALHTSDQALRSVRFSTPLPHYEREDVVDSNDSSTSTSTTDSNDYFEDFDTFLFGEDWGLCHEEAFDDFWKANTRPKITRSTGRRKRSRRKKKVQKDAQTPKVNAFMNTHPQALFPTVQMNYGDPRGSQYFTHLPETPHETRSSNEGLLVKQSFEC